MFQYKCIWVIVGCTFQVEVLLNVDGTMHMIVFLNFLNGKTQIKIIKFNSIYKPCKVDFFY